MAENADGQEKTEAPSGKRLSDARDKGQVAKSADLTSATMLLVGGILVWSFGTSLTRGLQEQMVWALRNANYALTDLSAGLLFEEVIASLAWLVLPVIATIFAVVVAAEIAQVGFRFAGKKFTEGLNFQRIFNPLPGLKKLVFSKQTAVELLKGFLKIGVVGLVAWSVLSDEAETAVSLMSRPYTEMGSYMFSLTFELVWKSGLAYLVLGMADFYYQKWNYTEELKMTKQEVKEENKQQEGDLQAKMRIRQMGRDRIRKIMLKNVAKADVVITNPTHYAVALKYDPLQSDAPVVVAKGVDFLAQRIKDIARAHDVPIIEDKPLARLLYRIVDVDQTIPESVFTAVANVLAYVWKLKKKAPPRSAA